ncbi:hypothetical protein HNP84_000396 [Thermocatellispora tengchongensis]|uniref:WD40 repeat domain-containing protein n=1 Tax=Thermocatellispora tengchongensis TaxID=1073253 RepID=A0A840NT08_9ACTN|nr:WD40 repeat domain-containing protein [Thermocatellispora tengchongensis]MBB5130708.1 hypothetical protein [Thermocatellispora tengchongensis]
MTIDELVRRTMREWAGEAHTPEDLAARVLAGRRRRRVRRAGAALAGAVAAAVAVAAVAVATPVLTGPERGSDRSAATADPTTRAGTTEVRARPGSSPPDGLIAAGRVAVYAYYVWRQKGDDPGNGVTRTWYLYDPAEDAYDKTPWATLDVAPGGRQAAVVEAYPASRVGLLTVETGEIRWVEVGQAVGAVRWSPDGTRLLATTYRRDPDGGYESPLEERRPARTGFALIDPAAGTSHRVALEPAADERNTRSDLDWSRDGTLVREHGSRFDTPYRFYDLDGKQVAAPPDESVAGSLEAGLSPSGELLAVHPRAAGPVETARPVETPPTAVPTSAEEQAVAAVRDLRTGEVTTYTPVSGYHIEQLLTWADDGHLVAWACEYAGGRKVCEGGEFRNRLVLLGADGREAIPLSGYREHSQRSGSWEPLFTPR